MEVRDRRSDVNEMRKQKSTKITFETERQSLISQRRSSLIFDTSVITGKEI